MLVVLLLAVVMARGQPPSRVTLSDGAVVFTETPGLFLGIPYGTSNRWSAPEPAQLASPYNASSFGPPCPQPLLPNLEFPPGTQYSEDCLSINVAVPSGGQGPYPVLFYIYGGALAVGGSSELPYFPATLAEEENIILVTFNYRVSAAGFLALPDMEGQAFGLADQRLALQWTAENIGAFGGGEITIAGQSAGGSSVAYMLFLFPETWPLFHRAIMTSGAPFAESVTEDEAVAEGLAFAASCGCSGPSPLQCMLKRPIESLVNCTHIGIRGQTVFLGRSFSTAHADVPIMFGNTADEIMFYAFQQFPDPVPKSAYAAALDKLVAPMGATSNTIASMVQNFPCTDSDCRPLMGRLLSDWFFICPTNWVGERLSPSYAYEFDYSASFLGIPKQYGVPHASGLALFFGNLPPSANDVDRKVSRLMGSMVGQFVRNATTTWPRYPSSRYVISAQPHIVKEWRQKDCAKMNV